MAGLYPPESNHFVDPGALARSNVVFLVARGRVGAAVGCGAIVIAADGTAEVKRMWVDPAARGGGIGRHILQALMDAARAAGISALQLETGVDQPEALTLYRRAGFTECGPFGTYLADPLSVFMEKRLR